MAATMERLDEYKKYNAQFCKRVLDYLSIVFTAQVSYSATMMNFSDYWVYLGQDALGRR